MIFRHCSSLIEFNSRRKLIPTNTVYRRRRFSLLSPVIIPYPVVQFTCQTMRFLLENTIFIESLYGHRFYRKTQKNDRPCNVSMRIFFRKIRRFCGIISPIIIPVPGIPEYRFKRRCHPSGRWKCAGSTRNIGVSFQHTDAKELRSHGNRSCEMV